jgi:hypothetical protein
VERWQQYAELPRAIDHNGRARRANRVTMQRVAHRRSARRFSWEMDFNLQSHGPASK